jgi:hypothetical protein
MSDSLSPCLKSVCVRPLIFDQQTVLSQARLQSVLAVPLSWSHANLHNVQAMPLMDAPALIGVDDTCRSTGLAWLGSLIAISICWLRPGGALCA